jgi:hypothetical protein
VVVDVVVVALVDVVVVEPVTPVVVVEAEPVVVVVDLVEADAFVDGGPWTGVVVVVGCGGDVVVGGGTVVVAGTTDWVTVTVWRGRGRTRM